MGKMTKAEFKKLHDKISGVISLAGGDREQRKRFPELAKLRLVSGRWQEALQHIEWLSEHGYMEPNIPADKTQELAARYLGLDIVKLRAETVQQVQEQGDQSDE